MNSNTRIPPNLETIANNDRRRFFRVNDQAGLKFREVDLEEYQHLAEQLLNGNADSNSLAGNFFAMSQQLDHLLRNFKKREPDIAQYVSTMNEKLDLLARSLFMQDNDMVDQPRQDVNISASGISFHHPHALEMGATMELKLLAYPSLIYIHSLCAVVRCEASPADADNLGFDIGLDFKIISEDDRELLIQHVVQLESIQLRNRRADS